MIGFTRFPFRSSARLVLTASITLVGGFQAARADLIAYESFSDPAGQTLSGMGSGMGFANSWQSATISPNGSGTSVADNSANYVVQATSLDGGAIPAQGGRVAALAQYSLGSGVTRDLSTPIGAPGSTVYISMLLRADGTLNEGASGGFFGLLLNASTTTPSTSQDLFIGKTGGGNFGLEDRGGNNSHLSSTTAAIGVSDFLVVKAEFSAAGTPDKFTLYMNPTATDMGTGIVKQDSNLGMVNSMTIYSTGAFSMDELRVGTTLGDVVPAGETVAVPEPASVAMLALAGCGVAAFARRRNAKNNKATV